MVLVLVSILAYVTVPNIEIVRFKMDGAARGAMAAMVSAQRLAVKRQHDVAVMIDVEASLLRIHQDRDNSGTVDDGEPIRTVSFDEGVILGRGAAPALGGAAAAVTFTETQDGLPTVRFLRNGSASEDGVFFLTSERSVAGTEYAKDTRAIRLDRPTGRVTWYQYDPPEWEEGF